MVGVVTVLVLVFLLVNLLVDILYGAIDPRIRYRVTRTPRWRPQRRRPSRGDLPRLGPAPEPGDGEESLAVERRLAGTEEQQDLHHPRWSWIILFLIMTFFPQLFTFGKDPT